MPSSFGWERENLPRVSIPGFRYSFFFLRKKRRLPAYLENRGSLEISQLSISPRGSQPPPPPPPPPSTPFPASSAEHFPPPPGLAVFSPSNEISFVERAFFFFSAGGVEAGVFLVGSWTVAPFQRVFLGFLWFLRREMRVFRRVNKRDLLGVVPFSYGSAGA